MNEFQNLSKLISEYAQKVQVVLQENLKNDGSVATGKLINSVKTNVKYSNLEFEVVLSAEDYLKWVNSGRNPGKQPPTDAILNWIKAKNIVPRERNGKLPTEKQLSYLIARKIGREGYAGTYVFDKTIEQLNAQYIPLLQRALEEDFKIYQFEIINKIK